MATAIVTDPDCLLLGSTTADLRSVVSREEAPSKQAPAAFHPSPHLRRILRHEEGLHGAGNPEPNVPYTVTDSGGPASPQSTN